VEDNRLVFCKRTKISVVLFGVDGGWRGGSLSFMRLIPERSGVRKTDCGESIEFLRYVVNGREVLK